MTASTSEGAAAHGSPITIAEQGSFFVGGTEVSAPGKFELTNFATTAEGQSFPVDHLFVRYQIPPNARALPLVMVHGKGQFGKTWESTPDGREGFQTIFLRRGFPVYIVDFPRRAGAGFPSYEGPLGKLGDRQVIPDETTRYSNQEIFPFFRLGPEFPNYFPNTQFPKEGLDQFLRQGIPSVEDDPEVISDALVALLDEIGPAILITHSQSGGFGWRAAFKSPNVKGIVTYEPGPAKTGHVFPEGEVPPPRELFDGSPFTHATGVAASDYQKLTQIPIQVVQGDNFPTSPVPNLYLDFWRVRNLDVEDFVATLQRYGGDASLLKLPDVGIKGNTHFPFSDLNNLQVADLLSQFLKDKGLDKPGTQALQMPNTGGPSLLLPGAALLLGAGVLGRRTARPRT